MNLAVSSIAWSNEEDQAVADILNELSLDKIEMAPTKEWPKPLEATVAEIADYKKWWNERGIEIVAMQSLLYGTEGLAIFEDEKTRDETKKYLFEIMRIAGQLEIGPLVFGSPKNRFSLYITNR